MVIAGSEIQIKRVHASDIPEIKELLDHTFEETFGPFISDGAMDKVKEEYFTRGGLKASASDSASLFLKAIEGDVVRGFVLAEASGDNGLRLSKLYVHPRYQGRGIGTKLFMAVLERSPGVTKIDLEVGEMNEKARAFYAKHGFKEVHSVVDPLDVRWQLITMERSLKEL